MKISSQLLKRDVFMYVQGNSDTSCRWSHGQLQYTTVRFAKQVIRFKNACRIWALCFPRALLKSKHSQSDVLVDRRVVLLSVSHRRSFVSQTSRVSLNLSAGEKRQTHAALMSLRKRSAAMTTYWFCFKTQESFGGSSGITIRHW